MPLMIKYVHTNIVARDWRKLAGFYAEALGCTLRPPERRLEGHWVEELTSLENTSIRGIHLALPGYDDSGPTLEIFEYSRIADVPLPAVNAPGLAHIAFLVSDVEEALAKVKASGGSSVGSVVSVRVEGAGAVTVAYARDPEGNIIELQKWS